MIKKKIVTMLAGVVLATSAYATEAGFGIDLGIGVQESAKQVKDADYQIQEGPGILLKDYYSDMDKYVALTMTSDILSDHTPVQLQIAPTVHFRKNLKYEADFVAKIIVPDIMDTDFDIKIGGLFGLGKVKASVDKVNTDNFLLTGTTNQSLKDTATFYKYGITTGISYPIFKSVEVFVNIDWINRKYNFKKNLESANGGGGDSKAAQLAMENYKVESFATSVGISYKF